MQNLAHLTQLLQQYSYFLLFPISILEGPIISILTGILASTGYVNFWIAYIVLIAGDLTGDVLYYLMGRYGGKKFIARWGPRIGLHPESMTSVQAHFLEHPGKTLFFAKTQPWGSIILAVAGTVEMPFFRFIWLNFISTLVKSFVLLVIGFYFGRVTSALAFKKYLDYTGIAFLLVGILIVYYFFKKRDSV